jgi:hypothetical protein
VEELAGFAQGEFVPDISRYHDGLSGVEFDLDVAIGVFEAEAHGAGDEVEEFVAIGMDLAVMWRVASDQGGSDREAVDAARGLARLVVDEDGLTGTADHTDDLGVQVDQLT